jgi:DNA-binding NarL/FixJ family response regulator
MNNNPLPNNDANGRPAPAASPSGEAKRRRILLVDDHPMMRAGLVQLIDKQPDLAVCGEAGDAAGALAALEKNVPDLLITDITLPGRSGIELIKDVRALHGEMPILVLTLHDESLYAERAFRAGARGYLMKDSGAAKLLEAIRQLLSGQVYVSQQLASRMLDIFAGNRARGATSPIQKLTDREFEVFRLIGQGKTAKQIGQDLHLSSKTVDVHRGNIKKKLVIYDVSSLVSYAARWLESNGTVAPEEPSKNDP